jgi:hypothetical protein
VFVRCVYSLQLVLVSAQMERVLKDDAVEEKGERARMVSVFSRPLSDPLSFYVGLCFFWFPGASPLLSSGSLREAPNRMPGSCL